MGLEVTAVDGEAPRGMGMLARVVMVAVGGEAAYGGMSGTEGGASEWQGVWADPAMLLAPFTTSMVCPAHARLKLGLEGAASRPFGLCAL